MAASPALLLRRHYYHLSRIPLSPNHHKGPKCRRQCAKHPTVVHADGIRESFGLPLALRVPIRRCVSSELFGSSNA